MTEIKKEETKVKKPVLRVNNSVNPKADTKYLVWCDHTTLTNNEGRLTNTKLVKGDIVDGKTIPQVWLDQGVASRFLIKASEAKKLTEKELTRRGYANYRK